MKNRERSFEDSEFVRFENPEGNGLRVLFVGNSITWHECKPEIGWFHEWGMAASSREKDYVHLCYEHIKAKDPEAVLGICRAALWERGYLHGKEILSNYENARRFHAQLIIVKLSANSPYENFDEQSYGREFAEFMRFLDPSGQAKVIVASEYYHHPAENSMREFAEANGYPFCVLSDLGDREELKALGLFEHEGVANHPGDQGMQKIAERICGILDESIL